MEGKTVYRKNYIIAKRSLDIVCSLIGLTCSVLPMIIISGLIKIDSKGPVIYCHKRIGKNGKTLYIPKFRTMYVNADEMISNFTSEQKKEWNENFKLDNDPRVTKIGKFLRKSSLDELPQFVSILKGDLSLVGPRPITEEELKKYGETKDEFLSVLPGLTGYWQAYARSDCSYEQRIEMELSYVKNANFWWDIRIIFATIMAVIKGRGAK